MIWTLEQAKDRFEEILDFAKADGPQTVEINGEMRGVIGTLDQWTSGRAHPIDWDEWDSDRVDDALSKELSRLGEEMKAQLASLGPIVEELDLGRDQTPAVDRDL